MESREIKYSVWPSDGPETQSPLNNLRVTNFVLHTMKISPAPHSRTPLSLSRSVSLYLSSSLAFKRNSSSRNKNSVIIYSPSCRSKPAWYSFFCTTWGEILRNVDAAWMQCRHIVTWLLQTNTKNAPLKHYNSSQYCCAILLFFYSKLFMKRLISVPKSLFIIHW